MLDESLDEKLGGSGCRDSLIVVEYQPRVGRPIAKIVSKNVAKSPRL
jgi:hypothetical protein